MSERGTTLLELVVAAILIAFVAGGAMLAFIMAAQFSQRSPNKVEAIQYTQETIERMRNQVACDNGWFNPTTCAAVVNIGTPTPVPDPVQPPNAKFTRTYTVIAMPQCGGTAGLPDCIQVTAKVSWVQQ